MFKIIHRQGNGSFEKRGLHIKQFTESNNVTIVLQPPVIAPAQKPMLSSMFKSLPSRFAQVVERRVKELKLACKSGVANESAKELVSKALSSFFIKNARSGCS